VRANGAKVTALGISAKICEFCYQKEGRRPTPIDPSTLNPPVTSSWLNLQEVSQSCPAETLIAAVPPLNH
jgi:hypothetical protein